MRQVQYTARWNAQMSKARVSLLQDHSRILKKKTQYWMIGSYILIQAIQIPLTHIKTYAEKRRNFASLVLKELLTKNLQSLIAMYRLTRI